EPIGQVPRVDDLAGERGRGGRLRRTQVDGILLRPGATREVPRHRTQADPAGRRSLPHSDAAHTARLVQPRARDDQVECAEHLGEILQDLARRRIHVERHALVRLPPLDHRPGHREVAQPGVGRRTDHDLLDRASGDLTYGNDVARRTRSGDQRFDRGEVDLLVQIVGRARICADLDTVVVAPSSASMLVITSRSIAVNVSMPGPWYSMMRFTPPCTPWRRSISRITSFALVHGGNAPVKRTPQISGIWRWIGSPAIAWA